MSVTIYHFESGNTEKWIDVNDDGTVTYHTENAGWTAMRRGVGGNDETMSAEEAKKRWPQHAEEIDKALNKLGRKQG